MLDFCLPLLEDFCWTELELELVELDVDGCFDFEGIIGIPRLPSKPNKGVLRILEDIFFREITEDKKTRKNTKKNKTQKKLGFV